MTEFDDRETYRVGVVVMCEARGVDAHDASESAEIVLKRLVQENRLGDADNLVGTSLPPRCPACAVAAGVTPKGLVRRHVSGETWTPEEAAADDGHAPVDACEGSGREPLVSQNPIVGFTWPSGLSAYVRIHRVMDVGAAAGNGHLWLAPTTKSFR